MFKQASLSWIGSDSHQGAAHSTHLLALNGLWHVSVGNFLCQALSHSGLAHSGLTNKARVVLGTPAQDLDNTLNLLLAANTGVQLALCCECGE